uniref:Uncharacterized protein n=1 Tax=Timema monikensis TaxID=170555 RepID=A0A7R9EIA6_9NEOP|nr:unnamed protein product [Timema monikensis]
MRKSWQRESRWDMRKSWERESRWDMRKSWQLVTLKLPIPEARKGLRRLRHTTPPRTKVGTRYLEGVVPHCDCVLVLPDTRIIGREAVMEDRATRSCGQIEPVRLVHLRSPNSSGVWTL